MNFLHQKNKNIEIVNAARYGEVWFALDVAIATNAIQLLKQLKTSLQKFRTIFQNWTTLKAARLNRLTES